MGNFKHKPLTPDPASLWKEGDQLEPSSYFSRTSLSEVAEGEGAAPVHHQEAKPAGLIGSGAAYPAARPPWDGQTTDAVEHRRKPQPPAQEAKPVFVRPRSLEELKAILADW